MILLFLWQYLTVRDEAFVSIYTQVNDVTSQTGSQEGIPDNSLLSAYVILCHKEGVWCYQRKCMSEPLPPKLVVGEELSKLLTGLDQ